ncbi:MAG: hypothetical protein CUN49_10550 [Candidatus Thermofonsia Clade 1 bacterium]|jgi:hypothetical protein|uniref:Uncharacterized protein n=1 Tax=Candidatus Thermofonsia Clade 1 bacterium TaxID=2364210 RepID=A0A2M8PD25_9CHLR|nr:MAG: hypothetical protein CUN49_10550 [Candidatus Thermofonsia Clade 1 bacterium]RMF49837.1 MAG: hypothetical protein D6749_12195 [Chloroflexota bacterium]
MFSLPLAHGALGWWDEIFVALAIGIFLVMFLGPMLNTALSRLRGESRLTADAPLREPHKAEGPADTFRLE